MTHVRAGAEQSLKNVANKVPGKIDEEHKVVTLTIKPMYCPDCRFLYECDTAYVGYRCAQCECGLVEGFPSEAPVSSVPVQMTAPTHDAPVSIDSGPIVYRERETITPPPVVTDKAPRGYIRIDIDFHFKRDVSIAAILAPLILAFPAGWLGGWLLGSSFSLSIATGAFGAMCCIVALRTVLKGEQ